MGRARNLEGKSNAAAGSYDHAEREDNALTQAQINVICMAAVD
ncbi:MAG TPA: hypothetical protein VN638_05900 [Nitrospiraceae bacterium]|nr:hypothetical protein [Nitrospiraceae bacterium]